MAVTLALLSLTKKVK